VYVKSFKKYKLNFVSDGILRVKELYGLHGTNFVFLLIREDWISNIKENLTLYGYGGIDTENKVCREI